MIFVVVSQSKIFLVVIYIWRLALASSLCEEHFFLKHARELHIIILRRKRGQAERMSVPSPRRRLRPAASGGRAGSQQAARAARWRLWRAASSVGSAATARPRWGQ